MSTYTSTQLESLKPTARTQELTLDKLGHGRGCLLLRILPNGSKWFYYRYFVNKEKRLVTVGAFDPKGQRKWRGIRSDGLTLAAAKEGARWMADQVAQFGDFDRFAEAQRQQAEADRRAAEALARQGSFAQLLEVYVAQLTRLGKSSATSVNNTLSLHVRNPFPALLSTPANAVMPADIKAILARLVQLGKTRQVNKLRSYLNAAFAYGGQHDNDPRQAGADAIAFNLSANPVGLVPRIAEFDRVGDRVLSEEELCWFWQALDGVSVVPAAFLRVNLALGGQRIEQLLRADWSDFDFDQRVLTLRDGKGRPGVGIRDHLVPLTDWALQQLEPVKRLNQEAPYPFATVTKGDQGKLRMDVTTPSKVVQRVSEQLSQSHDIPSFRAGDLRRTCETLLASLSVPKEIRAQLLSHGRTTGVQAKHYDRYAYLPEKTAALESWAAYLRRLVSA